MARQQRQQWHSAVWSWVTSIYDIAMTLPVLSVVGGPSRKVKNSSVLVLSAILVAETNITPKWWHPTKKGQAKVSGFLYIHKQWNSFLEVFTLAGVSRSSVFRDLKYLKVCLWMKSWTAWKKKDFFLFKHPRHGPHRPQPSSQAADLLRGLLQSVCLLVGKFLYAPRSALICSWFLCRLTRTPCCSFLCELQNQTEQIPPKF